MHIGILGINKPPGITSFDVVRQIKKVTGIKKIGHGGTLDPMAEGVLPILLGDATSFFDVLLSSDKVYEAIIQFGISTDTDDKEGKIIAESFVPTLSLEDIIKQTQKLTGKISQVPPIYSALKVNGKKAYDLARAGMDVELAPRIVNIKEWSDCSYDAQKKQLSAKICCGSGTYIRSLARDLSELLGTSGHLIGLKRLYSGGISLEDTLSLEDKENWQEHIIKPEKALDFLPQVEWDSNYQDLINGKPLGLVLKDKEYKEDIYVLMYKGVVVALIEYKDEKWNYKKNLARSYTEFY